MATRIVRRTPKTDHTTQTAGAKETTSECTDLHKLHDTIECMDSLSQDGFSEIAAIAKLALASLEHPDGYRHPENIVQALRAIWGKAENIEDCIGREAERVGCHYIDPSEARRYEARRAVEAAA